MTTCSKCKHWRKTGQGNAQAYGECRRSAPSPSTTGGPMLEPVWPRTLDIDGCGEFAAAPMPEPTGPAESVTEPARTPRQTQKGGQSRRKR